MINPVELVSESSLGNKVSIDSDNKVSNQVLKVGEAVEVSSGDNGTYRSGILSKKKLVIAYDVTLEDGTKESNILSDNIRKGEQASPSKAQQSFKVGDEVEAKLNSKYLKAVVTRKRLDISYTITYADGSVEEGVTIGRIRFKKNPENLGDIGLGVNTRVESRYRDGKKYFPGIIKKVNDNGTYDVKYDDGDVEVGVTKDKIRKLDEKNLKTSESVNTGGEDIELQVQDEVEVRYRGKEKYYPGVVSRKRLDGTYDIDYRDGEKESHVPIEYIRLLSKRSKRDKDRSPGRRSSSPRSGDEPETGTKRKYKRGDRVTANYRGRGRFHPARITRVRLSGAYDVEYEDGEAESNLDVDLLRPAESSGGDQDRNQKSDGSYQEGDKVEGNYKGKGKFYCGRISRVRRDGTYDIDYDDGEKETGVSGDLIRSVGGDKKKSDSGVGVYEEGEKVEGNYKGRGKFFPGRIVRVRPDGTYDIDYDDGEKEIRLEKELIRKRADIVFEVGEKVEADFRGRGKYKPGRITEVRNGGTFNIDYDDGFGEVRVPADRIRRVALELADVKVGSKVEARYRGKDKYYPGVVSSKYPSGSVDIDYDDGEKERRVPLELVRLPAGTDTGRDRTEAATRLQVGDKVEADYRQKGKYYPGKICRIRANGNCDIDYDDGEKEVGVEPAHIRVLGKSVDGPSARSSNLFREGDKVEGNYKGKGKYYSGRISRVRRDGTYDIDYDDGEKETGVSGDLIRSVGGDKKKSDSGVGVYEEGEKVEGNYKGRGKFFPGRIVRVRPDGTYDIDYDDGEKEIRLEKELIRKRADIVFTVGEKVEGNYKGKGKFFSGVISRARVNGTYDIDYDDGEKETEMSVDLIRGLDGGRKSGDSPLKRSNNVFTEGDKVEGNYKGKGKYYS
eukprot:gene182-183_t